jgi:hypothetical protein
LFKKANIRHNNKFLVRRNQNELTSRQHLSPQLQRQQTSVKQQQQLQKQQNSRGTTTSAVAATAEQPRVQASHRAPE